MLFNSPDFYFILLSPKVNRGGGAAEVLGQHGVCRFDRVEAPSLGGRRVLVVCPDFCPAGHLDLQLGLRHHQHLLGVKRGMEAGAAGEKQRNLRRR